MSERWRVEHGDCRDLLKSLPDASIDSIVTDPPYELGFMGKSWDSTGIAYQVDVWRECLRVLKHGGHLLSFGGSRTYHRMACAIEDAGFEIRDQIMWVYGSGFPKSLDVSKAIDKQAGAERMVLGTQSSKSRKKADGWGFTDAAEVALTAAATDDARRWQGWGTALKPAHEPIVLARKPLDGTVAQNVIWYGTGALNIDGCRVGRADGDVSQAGHRTLTFGHDAEPQSGGDGSGGWQQNETGRFPANFIHDGSDEVLELFPETGATKRAVMRRGATSGRSIGSHEIYGSSPLHISMAGYDDAGGTAARFFYCAKASRAEREAGLDGFDAKRESDRVADDGMGGENPRNPTNTARRNHHPTVKPIALMRYLIRLITPPGGLVLDPFTGSGTTGAAARIEGMRFYGIEQSADYLAIAEARINYAEQHEG